MSSNLLGNWTDERVALLRELHALGISYSAIAARIGGITRNAAIGKAKRIGLPDKAVAREPKAPKQAKAKHFELSWTGFPKRKSPTRKAPKPIEPASFNGGLGLKLFELKNGFSQCRYILGDVNGADTLYCGLPTLEDKSWCKHHDFSCHHEANRTSSAREEKAHAA